MACIQFLGGPASSTARATCSRSREACSLLFASSSACFAADCCCSSRAMASERMAKRWKVALRGAQSERQHGHAAWRHTAWHALVGQPVHQQLIRDIRQHTLKDAHVVTRRARPQRCRQRASGTLDSLGPPAAATGLAPPDKCHARAHDTLSSNATCVRSCGLGAGVEYASPNSDATRFLGCAPPPRYAVMSSDNST